MNLHCSPFVDIFSILHNAYFWKNKGGSGDRNSNRYLGRSLKYLGEEEYGINAIEWD